MTVSPWILFLSFASMVTGACLMGSSRMQTFQWHQKPRASIHCVWLTFHFGSPPAFSSSGKFVWQRWVSVDLPRVGPSVLARKKVSLFFPGRDLSAAGETWASASHWVIYLERTSRTSLPKEAAVTWVMPAGSTEFREHSEWTWHTFGKVQIRTLMENGGKKDVRLSSYEVPAR